MKSLSNRLLEVAGGILEDASLAYPTLRSGFVKDLAKLTQLVKHRGIGVFTLDLPSLESSLLLGLESGSLPSMNTTMYSKKYRVPRLFSGLYLLVFDRLGCLRCDADTTALALLRQLYCLGKKLDLPCSKKRELRAIEEYVNVESTIRPPTLSWESDSLGLDRNRNTVHVRDCVDADLPLFPEYGERIDTHPEFFDRCQHIADIVSRELGHFHPDAVIDGRMEEELTLGIKHGPGAVAEKTGRYIDKYDFQHWPAKLERLYPFDYFGRMPNDIDREVINHEVPARLLCVPKTAKGPRIIAAEPSQYMYTQMLLKSWLEERIKDTFLGTFINFKRQDLSGKLVERSSLDRSLSTIDLSAASDRLSLWLIERIFRKNDSLIDAIHASRTRWIHIPQRNEYLKLKKFASQGTAITFPIQTLVFLVIALSANIEGKVTKSKILKLRNQIRVYGDDIIVPTHGYAKTTRLLHDLGLKVNQEKSFSKGYFRESCGTDCYKGDDVTPVKPRRVVSDGPASCAAVIDTTNNLFYKGYWNATRRLQNRLNSDSRQKIRVMGRDAGATGYGSFMFRNFVEALDIDSPNSKSDVHRNLLRLRRAYSDHRLGEVRFNESLQRYEVLGMSFRTRQRTIPFDRGYSGLLDRSIRPTQASLLFIGDGPRGVPDRPHLSNQMRWEPLDSLVGLRVEG